ncbi:hypothetical protein E2562_027779 [Oryza meyeriana var. granulata]|uniref:Uncharacterized protein n=1 Tax=Oryza meyeriana var. granulata TaxID=110450 RepID=A0A6G1EBL8_9ORYZ|nr:hypothetical protein E2562_027779 [Oryza meyeriana var. granulata]
MEHETQPSYIRTTLRANGEKIVKKTKSTPRERIEKAVKRAKRSDVVDMMASYLEMRKKQSEEEATALSREREEAKMREEASKRWKNSQMKKRSEFDFRIDTKCNGKRGFSVVLVSQMEMGMNFVQPNAQFPVLHKSLSLDIKGIKTDIVISRYEDNFLVIVTQIGCMGTILAAKTMLHDWHRLVLEYGKPTSEEKANIKKKKACVEEEKSIADAEMDDEKPSREEKESIKKMSISDVEMDDEGHNVRRHSQMKDAGHLKFLLSIMIPAYTQVCKRRRFYDY